MSTQSRATSQSQSSPTRQQQPLRQTSVQSRSSTRTASAGSGTRERAERRRRKRGSGMPGINGAGSDEGAGELADRREPAAPGRQVQQPPNEDVNNVDQGGGDEPLKLRLDLNLDVAVEVKARVHGDLTLSLLSVIVLCD
ncbi:hypothetical protein EV361DRAFT_945093 [Lentinula raphanica]|nr:hypothetical protein FB446DRAFT_785680 [Lentinula raphanica]KAJ3976631.1 hypothetical protein EV361DRAFT_945093 [Lentinula raphanica]